MPSSFSRWPMKAMFLSWVRPERISLPMTSRQAVTVIHALPSPALASGGMGTEFQPRQHGGGACVAFRFHAGGHQRAAPVAQVVLVHQLAKAGIEVGKAARRERGGQ